MSSLLVNREPTGKQVATTKWSLLSPPALGVRELKGDLAQLWRREFAGASLPEKLGFTALRLVQHLAYRQGFGPGYIEAALPAPTVPDFAMMEQNLDALPVHERLPWLHTFLGHVNSGQASAECAPPASVIFELANTCNLNCRGCGIGRCGVDLARTMSASDFSTWAQMLCPNARLVRINGLGEATLSPQLMACLDALRTYGGGREIITNLTAPMAVYQRLLDDGFVILVSWDGATAPTLEAIRQGLAFEPGVAKLADLTKAALAAGAPSPVLLFTLRPENLDELPATVALADRVGARRFTVNTLKCAGNVDWTACCQDRIIERFREAESVAARLGVDLALPGHIGAKSVGLSVSRRCSATGCCFPWTQVVVRWHGDGTPCNMMNPYVYGNLRRQTLAACWSGPEARTFRSMANGAERHPYCRHCYYVDVAGGEPLCH